MRNYTVTWTIELEGIDVWDAARRALEIQRDGNSMATIFDVTDDETKQTVTVDAVSEEEAE